MLSPAESEVAVLPTIQEDGLFLTPELTSNDSSSVNVFRDVGVQTVSCGVEYHVRLEDAAIQTSDHKEAGDESIVAFSTDT